MRVTRQAGLEILLNTTGYEPAAPPAQAVVPVLFLNPSRRSLDRPGFYAFLLPPNFFVLESHFDVLER
jgi:hypothetical protein